MSGFRSNSHIESGDIVKQQYLSIRDKCQREHGAGSGHHVLDTSYEDLMDWIEDERLTRLPHRGSSWDRVLISAQHFADHENRLGHAIESFAPESGAASNLVFGQCLLLLERVRAHYCNRLTCLMYTYQSLAVGLRECWSIGDGLQPLLQDWT